MFGSGFVEGQSDREVTFDDDINSDIEESLDDSDEDDDYEDEDTGNWPSSDGSFVTLQPGDHPDASRDTTPQTPSSTSQFMEAPESPSPRTGHAQLSHPSSPRTSDAVLAPDGRRFSNVVVKDVAYSTYLAVLYYVRCDLYAFGKLLI